MTGRDGEPHWADAYYGELYFDSAADLLTPALSEHEAGVIAALLDLRARARVLDLACGHGRHAWPLAARGFRVVGLERSGRYLRRSIEDHDGFAVPTPPVWVRGDVRALPLRAGTFDAAYSWYSSLFMFDDETNRACLAAAGRALRPGGRLLVQHANPAALSLSPVDHSRRVLRDGSVVEEASRWDEAAGVDRCLRRLSRPDGTVLEAAALLRHYRPEEWGGLAASAGLGLLRLTSTTSAGDLPGAPVGPEAPDVIAVLERPA